MHILQGRSGDPTGLDSVALSDGTVLAVYFDGPADSPVTVVLHHGWTQDHTSWEDVATRLASRYRVLSYDARGHGRSDAGPKGSASLAQLADDLAEVICKLVPSGPVVIAGHSLGGPVFTEFVVRHPEIIASRVRGVAFVATAAARIGAGFLGFPAVITAPTVRVVKIVGRLRTRSQSRRNTRYPAVIEHALRLGLFAPGHATTVNRSRTAGQVARSHPETTGALLTGALEFDGLRALAGFSQTPTIVLAGVKDGLTPVALSRDMAEAMPWARFVVYPGAGHMLPYERPDEVADELSALAKAAIEA